MKEEKIWGNTETLERNDFVSVHLANVRKGFRCSIHKHAGRVNGFYLQSGELLVREFDDLGQTSKEHHLLPGGWCQVPANVKHRFESLKDSVLVEFYWVSPLGADDIFRDDIGGPLQNA